MLTSIILPARNELYLAKTIQDVLAKATGEIEVLPVIDGYTPEYVEDARVRYIVLGASWGHGKRQCMNAGAAIAQGKYLLFLDAHCMVAPGFDEVLKADMQDDWIVTPRRYKLDPDKWEILDDPKGPVDYMYVCWPPKNPNKPAPDGFPWTKRREARKDILIDDDMINQGSACFMTAEHYKRLGFMDVENYGGNYQEAQETCLKTWLSGGRVVRNKNTWYAHWRKKRRGWDRDDAEVARGLAYSTDFWLNDRWEARVHDLAWLIKKFAPVPTWPGDRSKWHG